MLQNLLDQPRAVLLAAAVAGILGLLGGRLTRSADARESEAQRRTDAYIAVWRLHSRQLRLWESCSRLQLAIEEVDSKSEISDRDVAGLREQLDKNRAELAILLEEERQATPLIVLSGGRLVGHRLSKVSKSILTLSTAMMEKRPIDQHVVQVEVRLQALLDTARRDVIAVRRGGTRRIYWTLSSAYILHREHGPDARTTAKPDAKRK